MYNAGVGAGDGFWSAEGHPWTAELTERQREILEPPSAGGASLSLRRYREAKAAARL